MGLMEFGKEALKLDGRGSNQTGGVVGTVGSRPDPEVLAKPERRIFTAAYKLKILEAVDRCTESGEIGAILRREGLYASHLSTWRRQKQAGILSGLSQKRGRKAVPVNPLVDRVAALERENATLRRELEKATLIIDVQKKVSDLLGISLLENKGTGK